MANPEHLAIIKQGVEVWNQWRDDNPSIKPDIKSANLKNLDLKSIDFSDADLRGTNFKNTVLIDADFSRAKLGLNDKLFLTAFVAITCTQFYFYKFGFLFALTVYFISLLLCLLRNFTANRKPFFPNSEESVSQSERKLWHIDKTNYTWSSSELMLALKASINHLAYVSLFSFIPLLFIAATLEPKLRVFSDNGIQETLIFFSTLIVVFYLGILGLFGFDINKLLRWLFFGIVPTSKFNNADLTNADFSFAQLTNSDFRKAILTRSNWYKVKGIKQTALSSDYTYLLKPLISNLILHREAKNLDLEEVNLSGLNLSNTKFNNSNLKKTQFTDSNLSGSTLTGACIESWNINSETDINDVSSDYVYLKTNKADRRPHSGKFKHGEFTKRYIKILKTVELYFDNGIDWEIFLYSFNRLQEEEKLKVENEDIQLPVLQTG